MTKPSFLQWGSSFSLLWAGRTKTKLRSFFGDKAGNVAITCCLLILPIGVAAGFALDYSRISRQQVYLQNAVDGAALSSAIENGNEDDRRNAGINSFFANSNNPCLNEPEFEFTSTKVQATASCEIPATIMGLAGYESFSLKAVARAGFDQPSGFRCIHALDNTASKALIYNNKRGPLMYSGYSIIAPDCDVQVNSNSSSALFVKEDEGYEFARHCIVGNLSGDINSVIPQPDPTCRVTISDPLTARALPSHSSCLTNGISVSGDTATLTPGTYCSGISVGEDHVVFSPGVYHVTGGDVEIEADASITGDGITIVMHPGSGVIEMETSGDLTLRATKSGSTDGFLIFDRNNQEEEHLLKTDKNDVSSMMLNGIIYTPEDHFELFWKRAGIGAGEKPLYFTNFGLIANTIDLHGYNQLYLSPPAEEDAQPEFSTAGTGSTNVRLLK